MSISERIRPGIEAAEWVCVEVAKLEVSYDALRQRVRELEANERAYEQIIGPKSYQEVADELATLKQGQGEPFGFITTDHAGCEVFTKTRFKLKGHEQFPVFTSAPTIPAGWHPLSEPPEKTGRYVVAHRGGCAGDAYYTAKEGDTHYPIGWSQMPVFQPSHWCKPPDKFRKDLLSAAPKPGEPG